MISKSLELGDYDTLPLGLADINYGLAWLRGLKCQIYVPHEHRLWEYASALQALREHFGTRSDYTLLDVGAGFGPFGPTAAKRLGIRVREIDTSNKVAIRRPEDIAKLRARGLNIDFQRCSFMDINDQMEAVTSISTLEHLPEAEQETSWRHIARLVAPGGLLFATVDFGDPAITWVDNTERETCFTEQNIERVVGWLRDEGMQFEYVDPTFHGSQVHNYTFFRLIGTRPA